MSNLVACCQVTCPHCDNKTPVSISMHDYDWKTKKYSSSDHGFYCIFCGGAFTVRALRKIYDVEILSNSNERE